MCGAASTSASPPPTRQHTNPQPHSDTASYASTTTLTAHPSTVASSSILVVSISPPPIVIPVFAPFSITIASFVPPPITIPFTQFNLDDSQISPNALQWMSIFDNSSPIHASILNTTLQFPSIPLVPTFKQSILTPTSTTATLLTPPA
ncbi:hypothetical protein O6H91_02G065600 [Diphasiastrum complanatum]|uniref:Uncharacterized protein n=1 Tax=Diphasiastrum complanatum TaxID=34168 RepID=A0ACC2EGJ3_DIPCM|nr:hypothetical protein O6H91_02G065600 [Diphasiastrum complanatum]